jgi:hypothetical protein
MGQNNFELMGFLVPLPENERLVYKAGIPYIQVIIECGPEEEGEFHPALITGKAAQVVYEELKKNPNGFLAIGRGSFKSYKRETLPVITYLHPYVPSQWLQRRAGLL